MNKLDSSTVVLTVSSQKEWQVTYRAGDQLKKNNVSNNLTVSESFDPKQHCESNWIILIDSADCWVAPKLECQRGLSEVEVAYQLEEFLPLDAEDMAIARGGNLNLWVVTKKRWLEELLSHVQELDITVLEIAPWVLFGLEAQRQTKDSERVLVCGSGERNELEFDRGQLKSWQLKYDDSTTPADFQSFDQVYSLEQELPGDEYVTNWNEEMVMEFPEKTAQWRVGIEFSFSHVLSSESSSPWKAAIQALKLILVFGLVLLNVCLWEGNRSFRHQAREATQVRDAVFKSVFPHRNRTIAVEKSIEQHLKQQRCFETVLSEVPETEGNSVLFELLSCFARHTEAKSQNKSTSNNHDAFCDPPVHIAHISLNGDSVRVEGGFNEVDSLNRFQSRLESNIVLSSKWRIDNRKRTFALTARLAD